MPLSPRHQYHAVIIFETKLNFDPNGCLARDDLIFYIKDLIKLGVKPSVTAPTKNEAAGGARDTPLIKPLIQVDLFTFQNFAKFFAKIREKFQRKCRERNQF